MRTYRHTRYACYLACVTQAIIVNLAPLLFVTFQNSYGLSLEKIGLLISVNFGTQILTDFICTRIVDRTGFRGPIVLAHALSAVGLVMLSFLPQVMDPYAGLIVATVVIAVGSGLIEVVSSPILETLPGEEKAAAMSLMHSFYCWGHVAVVLGSTAFFLLAGTANWRVLTLIWAAVPVANLFLFVRVPIGTLVEAGQRERVGKLFKTDVLWLLFLIMVCSGAAEQAMSQWASLFAETGLQVSKTMGDLLGPCAFSVLMGLSRVFYGVKGAKINLRAAIAGSAALCVASYLLAVLSPSPILALVGCALTGLSVGLMWPGSLSLSAAACPRGGAAMFAVLAMAGDVGCTIGPGWVGLISGRVAAGALPLAQTLFGAENLTQTGLRAGLLAAVVFPALLLVCVLRLKAKKRG